MLLAAASAKATGKPSQVLVEEGTFNAGEMSATENKHERKALRDAKHDVENFMDQFQLFKANDDYNKHGIHEQMNFQNRNPCRIS